MADGASRSRRGSLDGQSTQRCISRGVIAIRACACRSNRGPVCVAPPAGGGATHAESDRRHRGAICRRRYSSRLHPVSERRLRLFTGGDRAVSAICSAAAHRHGAPRIRRARQKRAVVLHADVSAALAGIPAGAPDRSSYPRASGGEGEAAKRDAQRGGFSGCRRKPRRGACRTGKAG